MDSWCFYKDVQWTRLLEYSVELYYPYEVLPAIPLLSGRGLQ